MDHLRGGDGGAATRPAIPQGSGTEQMLLLGFDGACMVLGLLYSARVLAPKPMTYLSEIAFPPDVRPGRTLDGRPVMPANACVCGSGRQFCVKLAASALLVLLHALEWVYEQMHSSWYLLSQPSGDVQRAVLLMMETLVWVRPPLSLSLSFLISLSAALTRPIRRQGMASIVLWMEYRRGLTPSVFLRALWVVKWVLATYFLVAHQQTWLAFGRPATDALSNASWSLAEVFGGFCYATSGLLALMCFGNSTPISPDFISFPAAIYTPSAYLASTSRRPPVSHGYGSFHDYVHVSAALWSTPSCLSVC
jgi:hypothetical protein